MSPPTSLLPLALITTLLLIGGCTEAEGPQALGTLERDRVTLSATAAEVIVAQPIAEGSPVRAGDLLVQLDGTLQKGLVAKINADIARQLALLEQLRNGPRREEIAAAAARVDTARAALHESEQDLTRSQELLARGHGTEAERDTLQSRHDANAARLRDTEAQLQLLRAGTRAEEIAQADAQLQALQAQLRIEQQNLRNLSVVATRNGILDSLPWQEGERVAIGEPVAIILADEPPYALVYLPESARTTLAVGSTLQVQVDGQEAPFTGTVRWIAREAAFTPYYALNSAERSRLVWQAEVQLPAEAADLPNGLPAQVLLP